MTGVIGLSSLVAEGALQGTVPRGFIAGPECAADDGVCYWAVL